MRNAPKRLELKKRASSKTEQFEIIALEQLGGRSGERGAMVLGTNDARRCQGALEVLNTDKSTSCKKREMMV